GDGLRGWKIEYRSSPPPQSVDRRPVPRFTREPVAVASRTICMAPTLRLTTSATAERGNDIDQDDRSPDPRPIAGSRRATRTRLLLRDPARQLRWTLAGDQLHPHRLLQALLLLHLPRHRSRPAGYRHRRSPRRDLPSPEPCCDRHDS